MEENREKQEKAFISYLDDDGKPINAYAFIISTEGGFVTFDNGKNVIIIPSHRLLKIKHPSEAQQ